MAFDPFEHVVNEAQKCLPDKPGHEFPRVAALITRKDELVASSFRGELGGAGDHAEFCLLEGKLKDVDLSECVLYTTLEPCVKRNLPKIPCAERVLERGIKEVWVGMVDPDDRIRGKGIRLLKAGGIVVRHFPQEFQDRLEEINRGWVNSKEIWLRQYAHLLPDYDNRSDRTLDEWLVSIRDTFRTKNYYRSPDSIFAHLVEVLGSLSTAIQRPGKVKLDAHSYIAKGIAWWLALADKHGVISVESLLWHKFPGVCPYCLEGPHNNDKCREYRKDNPVPDWKKLDELGEVRHQSLNDWQALFNSIYEPWDNVIEANVRLYEELGELAEAIRVFPINPRYFASEAADVFAWLMNMYGHLEREKIEANYLPGFSLEGRFARMYPDCCTACGFAPCVCPSIADLTVGRIAKEAVNIEGVFSQYP